MRDPLSTFPGYILRRASSAVGAELSQRLASLELRIVDFSVLLLVEANPGITQSELGRMLDIQRANMNPIAAGLSERKLIIREAVDGRSQGLALTMSGQALATQAGAIIQAFETELVERVAPDLRPHILPVLTALWSAS